MPRKKIFLLGRLYFVNTFFIAVATFTSDFVEKKRSTGMPHASRCQCFSDIAKLIFEVF